MIGRCAGRRRSRHRQERTSAAAADPPAARALGRFGLSMAEVQHFITVAVGGSPVGTLWEGERNFDVVLRLPESARNTIERISALRIPTKTGALIPCPPSRR